MPTIALVEQRNVREPCELAKQGDNMRAGEGEKVGIEKKDLVEEVRSFL